MNNKIDYEIIHDLNLHELYSLLLSNKLNKQDRIYIEKNIIECYTTIITAGIMIGFLKLNELIKNDNI